ncbi:MAG TPA: calcium-binding protein [Synechococcales cyanobacterium M55_K2018_004]|nr:calcium-binding protein [Synechococcales cyanobacterium M55_K2018_004]
MIESIERFLLCLGASCFARFLTVLTTVTVPPIMTQTVLYDGSLGQTPDQQGWLAYGSSTTSATQTASSGFTTLNSSIAGRSGYSNYQPTQTTLVNSAFPILDRTNGYNLSVRLRINSETHSRDTNGDGLIDRAGFSLILLSHDRQGIELGFWPNEVWAQRGGTGSLLFTHSPTDRALFSTTTMVDYDLLVIGNTYYLSANQTVILHGALQDYTAFNATGAGLPYNPYTTPNFLFLGDNTSSGASNSDVARISITTTTLGTANNDRLSGTASHDLLNGLAGNDHLSGGAGHDTLIGGDGNDTLAGGSGHDRLMGGSGADSFLYDTNAPFSAAAVGVDTILDFSPTHDRIVLDKTTFTALTSSAGPGFSVASEFRIVNTTAAVATSTARIVYNASTGELYYNQNGSASGLGTGSRFAILLGAPLISSTNVVIRS